MKKLLILPLFILSLLAKGQYDPSKATVTNKPLGVAQAVPTDARSYYYSPTLFIWRPYQSTSEVLSTLNLPKYRIGHFPIYVSTGALQSNGSFVGGEIKEYWFKNGVADSSLIEKISAGGGDNSGTIAQLRALSTSTGKSYSSTDFGGADWSDIGLSDGSHTDDGASYIITANNHVLEKRNEGGIVYPENFAGANDAAKIQAAIDFATPKAMTVKLRAGKTYTSGSLIYITCNFDGEGATLNVTGSAVTSAVVIQANKTANTAAILPRKNIVLPDIVNTTAPSVGWASQGKGVVINNLDACEVTIPLSVGFTVGVDVTANFGTAGTSYNKFHLGRIVGNQINLRLRPNNDGAYVNNNIFYGGKLGFFGGNENGIATLQLMPNPVTNNGGPNGNQFISTIIEGDADPGASPTHHLVVGGSFNVFDNMRFEFVGGLGRLLFYNVTGNETTDNLFTGGFTFGALTITQQGTADISNNRFEHVGRAKNIDNGLGRFVSVPTGGTSTYLRVYQPSKNLYTATEADTDWSMQIDADGSVMTKNAIFQTKASAALGPGAFYAGDGSTDIFASPYIAYVTSGSIGTRTHYLQAGTTGAFNNGHLKIGDTHFWMGTDGKMRFKGSTPTTAMDGAEVGGIPATGTTNKVARWTGTQSISTGNLYNDSTNVGIGAPSPLYPLHINTTGAYASIALQSASSTNGFWAPRINGQGDALFIETQNEERLRIFANGHMALNRSYDDGNMFAVTGTGLFTGAVSAAKAVLPTDLLRKDQLDSAYAATTFILRNSLGAGDTIMKIVSPGAHVAMKTILVDGASVTRTVTDTTIHYSIDGIITGLGTLNGNASQTVFDIVLPFTPTWVGPANPANAASVGITYCEPITNGMRIHFATAPPAGSANVNFYYQYK